jgi:ribosomal protein S18 acetylase RimI-like enzyme
MYTKDSAQIALREATDADLAACSQLDLSYETEYVWQMDVRDEAGSIAVGFRTARLPRVMRVHYPRESSALTSARQQPPGQGAFIVAEASGTVRAYLIMRIDIGRANAWISDLAIGRQWRRQGIGTMLLRHAYHHAQVLGLRRMTLETQTKNYPGICFCQKNGLAFCGFNDRYYPNYDIALFFGQNVRP